MLQVDKRANHIMNIEGPRIRHFLALLLKYLLVSVKANSVGYCFELWQKQNSQHKPCFAWWKGSTAYLRIVCSCVMKSKKKGKTKITCLMCLILVLSLFLCQSCDEEIKEKQHSESRMGINKSSGTHSESQGMLSMVTKGINISLPCVSGSLCAKHLDMLGILSRKLIFYPSHSAPNTHIYTRTFITDSYYKWPYRLSIKTGLSP